VKPKNFPARKLARQINATKHGLTYSKEQELMIENARQVRTKNDRSNKCNKAWFDVFQGAGINDRKCSSSSNKKR
jgi:hypothetical protein